MQSVWHHSRRDLTAIDWSTSAPRSPSFQLVRTRLNVSARIERKANTNGISTIGATKPLVAEVNYGEDFHGPDGLGKMHMNDPDLAPTDWAECLGLLNPEGLGKELDDAAGKMHSEKLYTLSKRVAHDEILHQLAEAEPKTITLIALGPMTNLALAYEKDPITFARCKQIISMGGCIDIPGCVLLSITDAGAETDIFIVLTNHTI